MRNKEVYDTVSLAAQMVLFFVLCLFLTYLTLNGRALYSQEADRNTMNEIMRVQAEDYRFYFSETIIGSDIVELIIKNDSRYDYYIKVRGRTYPVTRTLAKSIFKTGKDGTLIWTQDYLSNTILKDEIYKEYTVTIEAEDNGGKAYYFTEK